MPPGVAISSPWFPATSPAGVAVASQGASTRQKLARPHTRLAALPMIPQIPDSSGGSLLRQAQGIVGISPESMMRRSCVRRAAPKTLAEATRMRSAGSRWKLSGRAATSAAMAGVIETSCTSGGATACSSQSRRGKSNSTRPRPFRVAISQRVIPETRRGDSGSACARISFCRGESRGFCSSHQSRMCVSSRAFRALPSQCPKPRPVTLARQHPPRP